MSDHLFLYDQIQELKRAVAALEVRMSALDDALSATESSLDAEITRINAKNADYDAKIADLEAKAAAGATPEQLATLQRIRDKADAVDLTNPATLPPAP